MQGMRRWFSLFNPPKCASWGPRQWSLPSITPWDYSRTDRDAQQRHLADLTELEAEVLAAAARTGTKAGKLLMVISCCSREDCCWDDGTVLICSWGLDREIGVRGIKWGTVPGIGLKLGELWWGPERPGQGWGWGTGTWADRQGQALISKA